MSDQKSLIDQFVNYLRFERHFSPYTARCYGADLRQYAEYLAGGPGAETGGDNGQALAVEGKIKDADAMTIRGFLTHLDNFGYSPATTARKIATLRSFYKWMLKRGAVQTNPMLLIRTPKQTKRLPKAIGVEQIEKLLSAPDNKESLGARDRAILETLYSTGVRVSELVDLKPQRSGLCRTDFARAGQGQEGADRPARLARDGRHPTLPDPARSPTRGSASCASSRWPTRRCRCS